MRYKTIIFDLDGTLIHSAPDLQATINHALTLHHRNLLDLPTVISFIGNGVEKLVECALHETGGTDGASHAQVLVQLLAFYERNMMTLTRPYPGVIDALGGSGCRG